MKNLVDKGVAVMTLADVVDDYSLLSGNLRQTNILVLYRNARWAWKELFRTTIWNVRKAVLCLDCKDNTIRLPNDCDRMLAISVVDCYGKLHPLGFNPDWNTSKILCSPVKCSCSSCHGEDTLCGALDSISMTTETIQIDGTDYTQTTLTRNNNGAIQRQIQRPTVNASTGLVEYITDIETICNVEVTTQGCIKATKPNMDILRSSCGCGNFIDQWNNIYATGWGKAYRSLIPTVYNYWGEFNFNAADPQIVHIFGGGRYNYHFNNTPEQEVQWRGSIRQVIVDYQTNGETPNQEIVIPEYAVEAIHMGINYRMKMVHPRISEGDKLASKNAWDAAKMDVLKYLNPIQGEVIAKLQTNPRYW